MAITGLTSSTGARLIASTGALFISNLQHGLLDGPIGIDHGSAMDNVDYAGKSNKIAGLDRIAAHTPSISASFKEITDTLLGLLMPGSTTVTAAGVVTRTPPKAGVFLANIDNVRAIFSLSDGSFYEFRLIRAMGWRTSTGGDYPKTGRVSAVFEGRSVPSDPDASPAIEIFAPSIQTVTP